MTTMWYDEAGPITGRMRGSGPGLPSPRPKKIVDPLDIICRRCKAPVGQRCTDRYKYQDVLRKPHRRRKDDALLVQQAAQAMGH